MHLDGNESLITIITVVKDDYPGILLTAESLQFQNCSDYEWLIVDSSADGKAVEQLALDFPGNCHYFWTKPSGIFPAMNFGLSHSAGQYVWFVNAGDQLTSESTICDVATVLRKAQPTWLYGQVGFQSGNGQRIVPRPFDYESEKRHAFARGRFPPHQGTIALTKVLQDLGGFDTRFRIVADYHAALKLTQLGDPVILDRAIAEFSPGGLSSTDWRISLREFRSARREILQPSGLQAFTESLDSFIHCLRMRIAHLLGRT